MVDGEADAFEGADKVVSLGNAGVRTGRGGADAAGFGVAAHFLLTASTAEVPAAEALVEMSAICCAADCPTGAGAATVDAQA